ncbi:MAG: hypothetical protein IPM07_25635 [Anaerolineales bacterium]|nr:hypothetical protein [Anaerolineales bacterium]
MRVRDLGLAAKGEIAHSNPVRAVGVRGNHETTGLANHVISRNDFSGGASFSTPLVEFGGGDLHRQQNVFQLANRRFGRENGKNMEPKSGCKLKPGQNHHLIPQCAPFLQPPLFFGRQTALRL